MPKYTFIISSTKARREILSTLETETEVRHWIINHLDLSQDWTIKKLN